MLWALEAGRGLGARRAAQDSKEGRASVAAVEGAVFALLGLLIAFTFSGAMARFDARRQLIIQEANSIGTAYTRLDLLSPELQPPLRELFRQYLDSRLEVYRKLPDVGAAKAELVRSARLQDQLWEQTLAACRQTPQAQPATMLLVPALNQMLDISTTRTMSSQIHPPLIVFVMLVLMALTSAFLGGYDMGSGQKRNWLYFIGFPALVSLVIFVIIDLEFPRAGFIRIHAFDRVLIELRQSMN